MFREADSKNTNNYIQLGKEENGWGAGENSNLVCKSNMAA